MWAGLGPTGWDKKRKPKYLANNSKFKLFGVKSIQRIIVKC